LSVRDYKFRNEYERDEAEEWLSEYDAELPDQSDGSRINGDSIIYGERGGFKFKEMLSSPDEPAYNDSPTSIELLKQAVLQAKLSPVQAWILAMRPSRTQQEIAEQLGIARQTVEWHQKSARKKILKRVGR